MTQEALKLALEALISITDAIYVNSEQEADAVYKANDAITAIKEALAQPEQEPVAKNEEGRITWLVDDWPQNCFLYAEPPKWTPVEIGVDVTNEGAHVVGMYVLPDAVRYVFYSEFHFASQREPLTDKAITRVIDRMPKKMKGFMVDWDLYIFARAIEAAHGIKENT